MIRSQFQYIAVLLNAVACYKTEQRDIVLITSLFMENLILISKETATATSKNDLPGAGIADVQLQLYNVNLDGHHSHARCLSQQLPDVHVCGNGAKQNGTSEDSQKV